MPRDDVPIDAPTDVPPWWAIVRHHLEAARHLGAVGPGPVEEHLAHAAALEPLLGEAALGLDLGTGAGIPGLVLAGLRPQMRWVLLDAAQRRVRHVQRAVDELGWTRRVLVVHGRAEELGHTPEHARRYEVVVARSFGRAAVVAECAAPLVRRGGRVLVTEPPVPDPARWSREGLRHLGLTLGQRSTDPAVQELRASGDPETRFPRRPGVAARRPLW